MKNNKYKVLIAITAVVFSILMILVFSDCKSFSIDDYSSDIEWCSNYENMVDFSTPIHGKISAIKSAENAWHESNELYYDIGFCIYSVSYDKKSDCWLVEGRSLDHFISLGCTNSVIGGIKRAIIKSDGQVLSVMRDV